MNSIRQMQPPPHPNMREALTPIDAIPLPLCVFTNEAWLTILPRAMGLV